MVKAHLKTASAHRATDAPADTRVARRVAVERTTRVSVVVNVALSVVKILVGHWGHSPALIADGLHSLSDLASDVLVWFAGRHAAAAPDADHPYGHERYETVATLILGGLLLAVAVGIGWDAIARLMAAGEQLMPSWLALFAAAGSLLGKEWLFQYTMVYARRVNSDLLRANAWHHRSDAISSIIVLVGLIGARAGLPALDTVAALLVATMIARIAWDLGAQAMRELVDTGLAPERIAHIGQTLRAIPDVRGFHSLRTRTYGGRVIADVHLLVDPRLSVSEGHWIGTLAEQRLKRDIDDIADVTVHIDPEDDDAAPNTLEFPSRPAIERRLAELCAAIPEFAHHQRLVLHYLNDVIEVELFFPRRLCVHEDLDARIAAALADEPLIGRCAVYFG